MFMNFWDLRVNFRENTLCLSNCFFFSFNYEYFKRWPDKLNQGNLRINISSIWLNSRQHTHTFPRVLALVSFCKNWKCRKYRNCSNTIPCSVLNCKYILRLYFPMFQFRFRVWKNIVKTTRCLKPDYCYFTMAGHNHGTAWLPYFQIWTYSHPNFKLAQNKYVCFCFVFLFCFLFIPQPLSANSQNELFFHNDGI